MKQIEIAILGAGMSGVAFGRLLQLAGKDNFVILEAAPEPGGLCRSRKVGNHWLDIGGGHFLCTKFPQVYDFVFAHLPKSEFNFFQRVSKLMLEGHEIDYPAESNIWQLPLELQRDFLISAIQNGEAKGLPAPSNFAEWIRWKLGDRIAESYMLPYNQKIWGVEADELDIDWLHKIPTMNLREIVQACLERRSPSGKMPSHEGFYYPKEGGFQTIFDTIAHPLTDHIHLNTPAKTLEFTPQGTVINGQYNAQLVINTVPWSGLQFPGLPSAIAHAISRLRHNSITVSLHETQRHPAAHWVYEPDIALARHRSFFIHNFAPHSQQNGVYYETNRKRWQNNTDAIYVHHNDVAYPIPTLGHQHAITQVLDYMQEHHILGLGRWGQWQYFNSDVCIWEAMQLFQRLYSTLPAFTESSELLAQV
jgi:protoporphyrinogen oxidase